LLPFRLRERLARILKPLALRAEQKSLELICDLDPAVPDEIVADPIRLTQILVNLIGNAIKFTDCGEIVVSVSLDALRDGRAQLHFLIRDTGIGIPLDRQKSIFEAFSQADTSTTRKFGGTGLGLTICTRLAGMMEGRIWVESQAGEGSCFHFTIDVPVISQENANSASRSAASDAAGSADFPDAQPPLRILLAEDNPVNQKVAGRMLQRGGHIIQIAANGRDAVAAWEQLEFDLILMDVQMPELNGLEATATIRQRERSSGAHIPIIALTAHAMSGDRETCLAAGMDGFVTKPIDTDDLYREIRRVREVFGNVSLPLPVS
jgi:CheY-like chemotaxis protein